ncbi:MAG: SEC-C metal-binding domain-containing protein [Ardenticatenaceae bacterium]
MAKTRRNAPCPCGSGRKYKTCCGRKRASTGATSASSRVQEVLEGLRPALRMKGGVLYDPEENGFFAIVHTWDNMFAYGEPEEWRAPQRFPTEKAAMRYYKTTIRPQIEQMMAEMNTKSGVRSSHRKLE